MSLQTFRKHELIPYLIAGSAAAAAVIVTVLTWEMLQGSLFVFLFGAVVFSAWLGGLWPGVFSIVVSLVLLHIFVIGPLTELERSGAQFVRYVMFILVSGGVCWLQEQRLRFQRSLEGLRRELEVILNSVNDSIIAQDASGRLVFANQSAHRLMGADALQPDSRSLLERLNDNYTLLEVDPPVSEDSTLHERVLASARPLETVLNLQARTGEVRTLRVRGVPVVEPDQRVRLVVKVLQDITDERRLQEQQAASTRLLREVVNNLATFVGVVTLEGILIEANDAALRAANLQPQDVLGKHFADTYWWSYDPTVQQQLRDALARAVKGERVRYDVLVRLGPNSAITIDFMLAPVFDDAGQVKYLVASGIDITARIKLTQQLDTQQRRYRTILNNLPGIVYEGVGSSNAAEQKMVFVSEYAETLLGYPMEKWVLSDNFWREIVHPDDWDAAVRAADEAYQTGCVKPVPFRCYTADGRLLYMESFNAPIIDDDGELIGTCGVVMDVSDRHQQEQEIKRLNAALAVQRQRLEQIIANVPGIVYESVGSVQDDSFKLTYISTYVETMLGYTSAELIAQPELWRGIIFTEDWPELIERITRTQSDGTSANLRFRVLTRDQRLLYVELYASILRSTGDTPIGSVGVMMDVTQRQQQEAAIQRYAAELRRSNAELEQFAYVASHDLQEPLRMVTSYLQLVEQRYADKLDDSGKEFIDYAVDGAARMKELINDLLTYSRIQRAAVENTPVAMDEVFERVVHNLQLQIEDTGAAVTSDPLPVVTANRVQMVQLLQNLIGNALKFCAGRPPRVHVSAERQGDMWRFAVRDNGIGIEAAYLERIFVIFQRLHTRSEYEGTGIGLAICRRIVEKHGGQITVESTPGEGSTFYFTLPVQRPERIPYYHATHSNSTR